MSIVITNMAHGKNVPEYETFMNMNFSEEEPYYIDDASTAEKMTTDSEVTSQISKYPETKVLYPSAKKSPIGLASSVFAGISRVARDRTTKVTGNCSPHVNMQNIYTINCVILCMYMR